jgi:hypothetical protein
MWQCGKVLEGLFAGQLLWFEGPPQVGYGRALETGRPVEGEALMSNVIRDFMLSKRLWLPPWNVELLPEFCAAVTAFLAE